MVGRLCHGWATRGVHNEINYQQCDKIRQNKKWVCKRKRGSVCCYCHSCCSVQCVMDETDQIYQMLKPSRQSVQFILLFLQKIILINLFLNKIFQKKSRKVQNYSYFCYFFASFRSVLFGRFCNSPIRPILTYNTCVVAKK